MVESLRGEQYTPLNKIKILFRSMQEGWNMTKKKKKTTNVTIHSKSDQYLGTHSTKFFQWIFYKERKWGVFSPENRNK